MARPVVQPCPFCGNTPDVRLVAIGQIAECRDMGCAIFAVPVSLVRWNRRAVSEAPGTRAEWVPRCAKCEKPNVLNDGDTCSSCERVRTAPPGEDATKTKTETLCPTCGHSTFVWPDGDRVAFHATDCTSVASPGSDVRGGSDCEI